MTSQAVAAVTPLVMQVADGVWRVTAGAFPSNAYVCRCGPSGDAFVVDPGLDPETIDRAARELGLTPRQVFCTHGHFDHIGGAALFQATYGAEVFLHPADIKTMKSGNFLLMAMGMKQRITLPDVRPLEPGREPTTSDGRPVRFIHTPGHTPGSGFIAWGPNLFTGDSLYVQGVGLSKLPGEDHGRLRESLLAVWDGIGDEQLVHPGHGPSACFGVVRKQNRALLDFLAQATVSRAERA